MSDEPTPTRDRARAGAPSAASYEHLRRTSELYRTWCVIAIALVALILQLFRMAIGAELGDAAVPWVAIAAIGVTLAYELTGVAYIRWKIRRGAPLPRWIAYDNAIVESAIPTAVIALVWKQGVLPPDEALASPALLVYTVFITLSVLHLSPRLALLSGALCAVQHAALVTYAVASERFAVAPDPIAPAFLYSMSGGILLNGLAATFLAARLHAHVGAQLSERDRRRVLQKEFEIASRIQTGLLPSEQPDLAGYDINGWNRPADETGGDYFDWQPMPDGTLAVSVADVTGHGLGPALVTAFCRAYARASMNPDGPIERTVERINALLFDDMPADRFITFAVALIEPGAERVRLFSAGHGPILIYRHDGKSVESRAADGVPLGILLDTPFAAGDPIDLRPGDALVLITDGFFEWPDGSGQQFGLDRLREAIVRGASEGDGADAIIKGVRERVERYTKGTTQPDDLTIVVARRAQERI